MTVTQLFCLPYAGGSASVYHRWQALAGPGLRVCGVEYPGRGTRFTDPPQPRLGPLVRDLVDRLGPRLDQPYALFGHSMGGLVAFELTRRLRELALPQPVHLFISATAAPGAPPQRRSIGDATDAEVLAELRDLGGTPPDLLADPEIMALAVRTLRVDYTLLGAYEYRPGPPLDVPMTVFGGRDDTIVPVARLRGWAGHTTAGHQLRLLAGDHFFLHHSAAEILRAVASRIATAQTEERIHT